MQLLHLSSGTFIRGNIPLARERLHRAFSRTALGKLREVPPCKFRETY